MTTTQNALPAAPDIDLGGGYTQPPLPTFQTPAGTPCWTVRWGPEDDQIAHLDSRGAAKRFHARPTEIVQLDHPCHTITCATPGCGYRYEQDSDDGTVTHFPSRGEGVRWVLLTGWGASPAGPICAGCLNNTP